MSTNDETPAQTPTPLAAVSLKLPPYWPNDPHIWFAQVEAQFTTRGVKDEKTKYAYVIASLQPEVAQEVRDILLKPPPADPYKSLKKELIKRTTASEQKRLHQLLTAEELCDKKPSQLLRRMKQLLASNTVDGNILKQLFVQRLPTNVQLVLATTSDNTNIEELAALADKIMEVVIPQPIATVAAVQNTTAPALSDGIAQLQRQIDVLTKQVASLTKQQRDQSRGRSKSRPKSNNNRKSRDSTPTGGICWYHHTFGDDANHCRPPCTHKGATKAENSTASD
ncbi:uncharacterized protein [Apostichopus japonicus]|uniref:uncharacterized protein n=1 Tax=Stichopus japonicus TaxID=307972 RepID=UPI003AB84039